MTDNRTTERVDHPPRVREAIDELMREKDANDNRTTELLQGAEGGGRMSEYIVSTDDLQPDGTFTRERGEIVRCRDCRHMHTVRHWLGKDVDECWLHADCESGALGKERTEPDGFCAWAQRREVDA